MPGYVMHLAVAEEIIKNCNIEDKIVADSLRFGSVIPDFVHNNDKRITHFWSDSNYKDFVRKPDLKAFLKKYDGMLDNTFVFGYYAHLFFDYMYVTEYWKKHFAFYDENMNPTSRYDKVEKVKLLDENVVVLRNDLFSKDMYYGDYDRINDYIVDRFGVTTLDLHPDLIQNLKLIEETNIDYDASNLQDIVNFIGKCKYKGIKPKTEVLKLYELEEMIIFVANKLSTQYKKEVGM
ncbi:MAG: hypothetical protein E7258_00770 [Lachnospiraceae bacterium]|nr:hypothetical protein [Lachnospiraceae bacterium]